MARLKIKPNDASVEEFLAGVNDDLKRGDSLEILEMMREATGAEPKMWASSIVGFGSYHYEYDSGREGDWMLCGFSPRKVNLSIYIMSGFDKFDTLMKKLGKYKTGKSCLYVKKLDDVNREVLRELIQASVDEMQSRDETST